MVSALAKNQNGRQRLPFWRETNDLSDCSRFMKNPLTIGTAQDGSSVQLPMDAMRRHMLALGSSGSGKTVLCKVIVEEMIRKGLPVIAIDPQGDLASLAMAEDPAVLVKMGVDPAIAREFFDRVDVKIWTPGASLGIPLSFTPTMDVPSSGIRPEDRLRAFGAIAQSLAAMVGTVDESTVVAFSMILEYADQRGLACNCIDDFVAFLGDPPAPLARSLEPVFDSKARTKAHKSFLVKTLGANRLLFDLGRSIDCDELFGLYKGGPADQGKARLSIIYLNTLTSQDDKEIFISLLCSALYQWMLTLGNNNGNPWGCLFIDECSSYMPPVKNPASKQGLMLLLRQARKYGLCCLFGTQSPGDIDYRGLGQVGTIALGRIFGERAMSKVVPLINAIPGVDSDAIIDGLPGMKKGNFILLNPDEYPDGPVDVKVRWLATKHLVVTADGIADLVSNEDRETLG